MNPKIDQIPGLRAATPQEQQWIQAHWFPLLRKHSHPSGGKFTGFLSSVLFITGAVRMIRDPGAFVETALFFLLGGIVLFFSKVSKNASSSGTAFLKAIETGNYRVANVYATKLEGTFYGNDHSVIATLELPDGEPIKGLFRVPPECAQSHPRKPATPIPALLIFVDARNEILAIL